MLKFESMSLQIKSSISSEIFFYFQLYFVYYISVFTSFDDMGCDKITGSSILLSDITITYRRLIIVNVLS